MKFAKIYLFLLFLVSSSLSALAAQDLGKIAGKIIDKATGDDLIGATIQVEGLGKGAVTDIEGKFLVSLEPGKYTLVLNYISYKSEKLEVEVKPNEVTYLNFAMEESSNELAEVVVTYTVKKTTALAVLIERKNAAVVSDGVSAELIRRTPDRTTSDVLKRVTGASIQEGKFAVIRGMNDRYNVGYLDGALLPSTESDRKAFAFDVVPANLIDNLQIIKAGSPDLVGDFGGGIIRINTKSVPEEFTQTISIGGQSHSLTTFKSFTEFKKYPGESLNFLSDKRTLPDIAEGSLKLPGNFPTSEQKAQLAEVSKKFNHDWDYGSSNAIPNGRFAYSLGFPVKLSEDKKLGVILALNYSNTRRYSKGKVNSFNDAAQSSDVHDQVFMQNITSGGIFNVSYVAKKTQINFRNLLNVTTDNNTILRTGIGDISSLIEQQTTANMVNYNRLYSGIVSLKQIVGNNLFTINASANYANVRRRIPDYRIVNYTKTDDGDPDTEDIYTLSLGDFFNTSTGRFSSDLEEGLSGGTIELGKDFNSRNLKTNLKAGFFIQTRDRSFYSRTFVYNGQLSNPTYDPSIDLAGGNIAGNKLYLVEKTSNDIAYYNGKQNLSAFYVAADQRIFEKLRAVYGVRYEDVDIHLTNDKIGSEIARIQEGAVLPSVNFSYALTEKMNLRAGYYASVNRPEFRELAPFAFYVFDKNAEIKGNKDLKIARLNNAELRWELFPSGNQVVSVGGFYKTITNPVEFSIDVAQPFTTFTFENEKSATIYGAEFEVRKNFDFIGEKPVWHDLTIFSNLALIKSELKFEPGSKAKLDRPLQGQSPYVVNAGIQYESETNGWFASAVVNQIGRRIAYVGVDPQFGDTRQDIFEAPRTVLDLQVGKNLGKLNLKFTLGDLLKQDLTYYQDADNSGKYEKGGKDRLMFQFTNGLTLNLSAGYTF